MTHEQQTFQPFCGYGISLNHEIDPDHLSNHPVSTVPAVLRVLPRSNGSACLLKQVIELQKILVCWSSKLHDGKRPETKRLTDRPNENDERIKRLVDLRITQRQVVGMDRQKYHCLLPQNSPHPVSC